jgi:hypothetical protein
MSRAVIQTRQSSSLWAFGHFQAPGTLWPNPGPIIESSHMLGGHDLVEYNRTLHSFQDLLRPCKMTPHPYFLEHRFGLLEASHRLLTLAFFGVVFTQVEMPH